MAKQTINIGASPNDGTGTPLRTAFDYTNQNFTELYTATGPSGNNIVVPGSATITGDLTARTTGLVVNATGVGIGMSPTRNLSLFSSSSPVLQLCDSTSGTTLNDGLLITQAGVNTFIENAEIGAMNFRTSSVTRYSIDATGISTWSVGGSTAMTLNATGLKVGTTSNYGRLTVGVGSGLQAGTTTNVASTLYDIDYASTGDVNTRLSFVNSNGVTNAAIDRIGNPYFNDNGNLAFLTRAGAGSLTERMRITSDGNVGIGVAPSAWAAAVKALQIGAAGAASYDGTNYDIASNRYLASGGTSTYITTGFATMARQVSGQHLWYTAPSGTAGTAITFTQAMTLDASGNLLVGKTASSSTVIGAELRPSGAIISTLAASTNADFALYTYSTGAGAARFYVGMSGTVFATNTTISAISDQRLKENVQDIDVGLGAILALKPRKFDWKEGKGKDIKGDRGFIAQEFEQVFPQLVDEWADPSPEGEAPYKSVRQDLIPVLVKAIQELAAEVNALKNA